MKNAVSTPELEVTKTDPRLKLIAARIKKENHRPDSLIEILHTAQNAYGYLPVPVLKYITRELHLPPSRVYSTITFYHFFSLKSKGEHSCLVCTGTACYVKGASAIMEELESEFGIKAGAVSGDGRLGIQVARCIGACGLAPVAVLDDEVHGRVRPGELSEIIHQKLAQR